VLQRILTLPGTEGEEFDKYRKKVEESATTISEEVGQKRLLDELSLAVEEYDPFEGKNLNNLTAKAARRLKKEDKFKKLLPKLLRDVYMRENCWLKEGGVIERFYERHIGGSTSEGDELEFTEEDLPTEMPTDVVRRKAPEAFRAFKRFEGRHGDEFQAAAVRILSECLDRAIRRFHNFDAQNLFRMMIEVRRALHERGISLILLIEDIAAVQGIDRQLVAAVQEREDDHGSIQTVMGCTEGYYNRLASTAVDRVHPYRIDLNISREDVEDVDIASFAARYLNAVRHGEESLEKQASSVDEQEDLSSWCETCNFQERCHKAFGDVDGMGLYPFNETALRRMYDYIGPDEFNPRVLIRSILRHTLLEGKSEIESGDFPSSSLHNHYLGRQESHLTASARRQLRENLSDQEANRWAVLLDLWSDEAEPSNFPDALHEALDISKIDARKPERIDVDPVEESTSTKEDDQDNEETDLVAGGDGRGGQAGDDSKETSSEESSNEQEGGKLQQDIERLDKWVDGTKLPQQLARELRRALHSAIEAHIDWDSLGLSQSFFSGKTSSPFQPNSIQFEDAMGGREASWVELTIPLEEQNRTDVAFALQGYRQFRKHGHWHFSDDPAYLREFLNCLDAWASAVIDQLEETTSTGIRWDPAPMAAELLAVGARLHGRTMNPDLSLGDRLESIVADFEPPSDKACRLRSDEWLSLAKTLRKKQASIRKILEAHSLCLKGKGQTKIYDVRKFDHVLSSLEKGDLKTELPVRRQSDFRDEYSSLRSCYRRVKRKLGTAVEEEADRYRGWDREITRHLAGPSEIPDLIENVYDVLWEARGEAPGMQVGRSDIEELKRQGEALRLAVNDNPADGEDTEHEESLSTTFKTVENVVQESRKDGPLGRMITLIGRDETRPMEKLRSYVTEAAELLETAHDRVQGEIEQQSAIAGGIEETLQGIQGELSALDVLLYALRTPADFDVTEIEEVCAEDPI
jgi:hypothetical protein